VNVRAENIAVRLESAIGAAYTQADRATCEKYAIDGVIPAAVATAASAAQVVEVVRFARDERLSLIACGHRTKLGMGMPPEHFDVALDVSGMQQIAYYDPADLTLSVDAGMSLAKLNEELARQQQFLPLAVPFYEECTVGGAIAAGLSSSLRNSCGSARDFLLGAEFANGAGALSKSGGRVVKNVTGYDLHKLLIGSLGTLAVITRLNFRTFPLPQGYGQFAAAFSTVEAVSDFTVAVGKSSLTPRSVEILSPEAARRISEWKKNRDVIETGWLHDGHWHACIGFDGDDAVLHRYASDLTRCAQDCGAAGFNVLENDAARMLSEALRELLATVLRSNKQATIFEITTLPTFSADVVHLRECAARFSIPGSVFGQAAGPLYFALEPSDADEETVAALAQISSTVFEYAAAHRGQARILFCPVELKRAVNVWGPARGDAGLMRRVKNAFDTQNIFAPRRYVSGI
jgi:glycolate oxidase FAD binding subunit